GRNAPGSRLVLDWTSQCRVRETLGGYHDGRHSLTTSVEDALRLGADGVLTYIFIGLDDPRAEADLIDYNGRVSRDCERLGVVRCIETMARGSRVAGRERSLDLVRAHARLAAEIGADLIKTEWTGDVDSFHQV